MATSEAANPETPEVEVKEYGTYIVANPRICHGNLTIRGTRILVRVILDQVARGMDRDTIVKEWRGKVPTEAIEEAVRLAQDALLQSNEVWRKRAVAQLTATR